MNLTVTADLLQDVSPGAVREIGFRVRTEPIIPGSVLRGALATAWIRNHGIPTLNNSKQAEFVELFEGTVRYSYLYGPGCEVVPLSVLRCKYKPEVGCSSFFIDDALQVLDGAAKRECSTCNGPLEPSKGSVTIDTRTDRTRTELMDDERADEGKLFSRQVLSKGNAWKGQIFFSNSNLGSHLKELATEFVFLGGSKSTLGRACLALSEALDPAAHVERSDGKVLIRLTSPGIFLDHFGRPTMDLPLDEISQVLGVKSDSLKIDRAWVRPTTVGGWHAASGLPKPTDWACMTGSTWLITGVPAGSNLTDLAVRAFGFRLAEGHGSISVNASFQLAPAAPALLVQNGEEIASVDSRLLELPEQELRWLIGELKQARVHLEATGAALAQGSPNRRTRSYSAEMFEAVSELLAADRVALLSKAITELQGALS